MIKNRYNKLFLLLALLSSGLNYAMNDDYGVFGDSYLGQQDFRCELCETEFPDEAALAAHWWACLKQGAADDFGAAQEPEWVNSLPAMSPPAPKRRHDGQEQGDPKKQRIQECQSGVNNDQEEAVAEYGQAILDASASGVGYTCTWDGCRKSFGRRADLNRHIKTHSEIKPFKCYLCSKAFGRNDQLQVHYRKHTDERPFKCEYCTDSFKQKVNLDRHVSAKHPEECSAQLDMTQEQGVSENGGEQEDEAVASSNGNEEEAVARCGQAVSGAASVSGAGYRCTKDGCGKSFSQRGYLNKHIKTHTGEKPFVCDLCKKGYAQSGSLKKHVLRGCRARGTVNASSMLSEKELQN